MRKEDLLLFRFEKLLTRRVIHLLKMKLHCFRNDNVKFIIYHNIKGINTNWVTDVINLKIT